MTKHLLLRIELHRIADGSLVRPQGWSRAAPHSCCSLIWAWAFDPAGFFLKNKRWLKNMRNLSCQFSRWLKLTMKTGWDIECTGTQDSQLCNYSTKIERNGPFPRRRNLYTAFLPACLRYTIPDIYQTYV